MILILQQVKYFKLVLMGYTHEVVELLISCSITGLTDVLNGKQAKSNLHYHNIMVADWSGGTTCTKSMGVTATTWNDFAFAESYRDKIIEFDVRPSGQGAGTITFTAGFEHQMQEIVFTVAK